MGFNSGFKGLRVKSEATRKCSSPLTHTPISCAVAYSVDKYATCTLPQHVSTPAIVVLYSYHIFYLRGNTFAYRKLNHSLSSVQKSRSSVNWETRCRNNESKPFQHSRGVLATMAPMQCRLNATVHPAIPPQHLIHHQYSTTSIIHHPIIPHFLLTL